MGVEPPRDASHGDIATNAAMVLSKAVGQNPRELADKIGDALKNDPDVGGVRGGGSRFHQSEAEGHLLARQACRHARTLGSTMAGRSSAMGTGSMSNMSRPIRPGPMHVGHCRGAVVGDALANLLKFAGYDVAKEYYINDAGAQIDVLASSVMLRYREALGEQIGDIPAGLYPGDYLVPVGQALAARFRHASSWKCRKTRRSPSSRTGRSMR